MSSGDVLESAALSPQLHLRAVAARELGPGGHVGAVVEREAVPRDEVTVSRAHLRPSNRGAGQRVGRLDEAPVKILGGQP